MDKNRCAELVIAYGEVLENDVFTPETITSVFAEDAEAVLPNAGPAKGIIELVGKHCEMMGPFTGAHHNITNIGVTPISETESKATWHMEVIHQFKPEIAQNLPGELFIVNDRVTADIVDTESGYKIKTLTMDTVFKRFTTSAPE